MRFLPRCFPQNCMFNGVDFTLAPGGTGKPDAVVAKGQAIDLPAGDFNRSMCSPPRPMAISRPSSVQAIHPANLTIENWGGFIGQWDTRLWKPRPDTVTEGGGRYDSEPAHQVPLRKDWAVSANHATWDLTEYRGSPDWSPSYPDGLSRLAPRLHQARNPGLVCLASPHARRTEPAVCIQLSLRVWDRSCLHMPRR